MAQVFSPALPPTSNSAAETARGLAAKMGNRRDITAAHPLSTAQETADPAQPRPCSDTGRTQLGLCPRPPSPQSPSSTSPGGPLQAPATTCGKHHADPAPPVGRVTQPQALSTAAPAAHDALGISRPWECRVSSGNGCICASRLQTIAALKPNGTHPEELETPGRSCGRDQAFHKPQVWKGVCSQGLTSGTHGLQATPEAPPGRTGCFSSEAGAQGKSHSLRGPSPTSPRHAALTRFPGVHLSGPAHVNVQVRSDRTQRGLSPHSHAPHRRGLRAIC